MRYLAARGSQSLPLPLSMPQIDAGVGIMSGG